MDQYTSSADKLNIHFNSSGTGETALVFVHGWLGSTFWWKDQIPYFENDYTVVTIDLAGHGTSAKDRKDWSSRNYANDINAVINQLDNTKIILIGHSMAGAFVLEAALHSEKVKAIIVIDTLKDMDKLLTYQQAYEMLFSNYRRNFTESVEQLLPKFLFSSSTPSSVIERLKKEFLSNDPQLAISLISPLYKMDIKSTAVKLKIPVRALNSDFTPTNKEANQKYFKDYSYTELENTGHYPMLEDPAQFNGKLNEVLKNLP